VLAGVPILPGVRAEQPAQRATDELGQPPATPGLSTSTVVAADAPQSITTVEQLLDAIDTADRQTQTLTGPIRHVAVQALAGDMVYRDGVLTLATDWAGAEAHPSGLPLRRFAVSFTSKVVDKRKVEEKRDYVFDGRHLVERIEADKHFARYELVSPGERYDPIASMGNSKLWFPVGQDASLLKEKFDVELLGPTAWFAGEAMPPGLVRAAEQGDGTVQMRLVPKAGTPVASDWTELRLWFDARTMIPTIQAVLEPSGDQQITILYNMQRNTQVAQATFDTTPPPASSGWSVSEHPLRAAQATDAAGTTAPGAGG
jgi:hypothetical protein